VEALIKEIPQNKLITTELLRQELAARRHVQVTCPAATNKALKAIACESDSDVAYWRVIKKSGEMIALFPGGVIGHAAQLTAESFTIDTRGKTPKVTGFKERLVQFDTVLGTNCT